MRWLIAIFVRLRRNERDATSHFGIPPNRVVEIGARLELSLKPNQQEMEGAG